MIKFSKMDIKSLKLKMLGEKLEAFDHLGQVSVPESGWVAAIRTSLNMTLEQLGRKLGVSRQAVGQIEKRESEGSITLSGLRDVANALDMQLVYAIVPKEGTLEDHLENRAREMARELILSANQQMRLEDQAVKTEKLKRAIEDATAELVRKVDRQLWD